MQNRQNTSVLYVPDDLEVVSVHQTLRHMDHSPHYSKDHLQLQLEASDLIVGQQYFLRLVVPAFSIVLQFPQNPYATGRTRL